MSGDDLRSELIDVVRALKAYVQAYPSCCSLPARAEKEERRPAALPRETAKKTGFPAADRAAMLESLQKELLACSRCCLGGQRKNLVFGEGNPYADLVFVGEAPGADEDRLGRPFVGRAGQLLTRMIIAMGLKREDVYICNILKCRPPGNRNPEKEEIAECEPYLIRQLEIIKPKIICALGTFAAQTLLKKDVPITALRGRYHDYHGIKLMPTYHPAYLLRNAGAKKLVWEDLQVIMKDLGLDIKG